jgi:hypothetical protein
MGGGLDSAESAGLVLAEGFGDDSDGFGDDFAEDYDSGGGDGGVGVGISGSGGGGDGRVEETFSNDGFDDDDGDFY